MKKRLSCSALSLVVFICFALVGIVGCAPTRNVIPRVQYTHPIDLHIPKNAHIYWVPGRQISGTLPSTPPSDQGIIGNLVFSVLDEQDRKNHPSKYTLAYGKADQAVFITSLRDALSNQNTFKSIELTTDLKRVSPKDVLLKVYFKTTRVTGINNMTITVELDITSGHSTPYKRTYFVQNDSSKGFLERKIEISQELLEAVIRGIKEWYEGNK